jgi:hypothetical protein
MQYQVIENKLSLISFNVDKFSIIYMINIVKKCKIKINNVQIMLEKIIKIHYY